MKHQVLNVLQGVLTFYLVATAWLTARRRDGEAGIFDLCAFIVPLAVGTSLEFYGLEAANSRTGSRDGFPAGAYFIFGSVALLFAAGDVRTLVRGGVSGVQRIARHLCRMCYALFIAAGSFFLGATSISRCITQNKRTFYSGFSATDTDDFLDIPSSLHKCSQRQSARSHAPL
jgi:hypothetical protein